MAKTTSYSKGVLAEKRAVLQLRMQGYKILFERYKTKYGEIDVVAQRGKTLVFVEVKAHQSLSGSLEAVTERTRRRIEQSALWFLHEYPEYADCEMRFDVIAFKAGGIWGQHLDNAWMVGS